MKRCVMSSVLVGGLCAVASVVSAQEAPSPVQGEIGVWSGYIFRGVPQFVDPEVPALQGAVELGYPDREEGLWGRLWLSTALSERTANTQAGRTDEVDVALGYRWKTSASSRLTLGGIVYLRPEDEPLDVREEVVVRWEIEVPITERLTLRPYGALYGEVYRMLGVYGEVGLEGRLELEYGFWAVAGGYGGTSYYARAGVVGFDVLSGRAGLEYTPTPGVVIAGVVNAALTSLSVNQSPNVLDEHGLVWSGLELRYAPAF